MVVIVALLGTETSHRPRSFSDLDLENVYAFFLALIENVYAFFLALIPRAFKLFGLEIS